MKHPLHALCPYFAMFPANFVIDQLLAYSSPGDLVLDPFSGRGTTALECLLNNRDILAIDVNSVAACVSGAKINVPQRNDVVARITTLETEFLESHAQGEAYEGENKEFFRACYHEFTLNQLMFLRIRLDWKNNAVDRFLSAALLCGIHGESHRSQLCLSNRMPRTISTKPDYSIKWWRQRGYVAPRRNAFEVARKLVDLRYSAPPPARVGRFVQGDARHASCYFSEELGRVKLVVTSPPYIDTTDYAEDQWLRLWFLGGEPRPILRKNRDDRHTKAEEYWKFLAEAWAGCAQLLSSEATVVVRIGGALDGGMLLDGLYQSLQKGLGARRVELWDKRSSEIRGRQTNAFRPGTTNNRVEHDFAFRVN